MHHRLLLAATGAAAVRPAASFSTLITFDVDGTLVSSSEGWERGAHGRSFVHAVDSILGGNERGGSASAKKTIPELLEKHEFHGSTDGLILLRLARKMLGPSYDDRPKRACVSVVGVATGSYSVGELTELCGEPVPGEWEPVILDEGVGVGDTEVFLRACGLI